MISKLGNKLAAEKQDDWKTSLVAPVVGSAVPGVALVSNKLVAAPVSKRVNRDDTWRKGGLWGRGKRRASSDTINALRKELGVPGDVDHVNWDGGFGPAYDPITNTVYTPTSERGMIAHEFGHASSPVRKLLGRKGYAAFNILTRAPMAARGLGLMGLGSALTTKGYRDEMARLKGTKADSTADKALSAANIYSLARQGAILGEEGQASIRGLNAIRKLYGNKAMRHSLKYVLPAYGTYALAAGAELGGTKLLGKYLARRAYAKQQGEK